MPSNTLAAGDVASSRGPRADWVDVARGIGIALVVLGHTLRGLTAAHLLSPDGAASAVDRFLYSFHMPLFFFLSGLFLPDAVNGRAWTFTKSRVARLAYPYAVWVPAQVLLQQLGAKYANHSSNASSIARAAYDPPMQFWFLYTLFLGSLLFAALWRVGLRNRGMALAAIGLFVTAPIVSVAPWFALGLARLYFPYLVLGACLGTRQIECSMDASPGRPTSKRRCWLALLGFVAIAVLVAAGYDPETATAGRRFVVALIGIAAVTGLSLLPTAGPVRAALRYVGQRSLPLYVAHTIASAFGRAVLLRAFHVDNVAVHLCVGFGLGMTAPLALAMATERLGFPYLFTWTPPARQKPASIPEAWTGLIPREPR